MKGGAHDRAGGGGGPAHQAVDYARPQEPRAEEERLGGDEFGGFFGRQAFMFPEIIIIGCGLLALRRARNRHKLKAFQVRARFSRGGLGRSLVFDQKDDFAYVARLERLRARGHYAFVAAFGEA
jgi:hypothetical protein